MLLVRARSALAFLVALLFAKDSVAAPTDPAFYSAVVPMAQRLDSKPEDLLWVWASETGFKSTDTGEARTISTLMHSGVVPSLLTQAEWDSLPTLGAAGQLPYIERFYKVLHDRYLGGRGFQDTFEAYLANAGPGLLRRDGQYNPNTTLYGNPDAPMSGSWSFNWPMDNYPVARQEAASRGVAMTVEFGRQLVSEGLLKGWITLGDLKNFMLRSDVTPIANDAIKRLHDAQAQAEMQAILTPVSYTTSAPSAPFVPSFGKSFANPAAPVDTRLAPSAPWSAAAPGKRSLFSLGEVILVTGVVYFALRWFKK